MPPRRLVAQLANSVDKKWWFGHHSLEEVIASTIRQALRTVREQVHCCPHQPGGCDTCWELDE